jgi:accessory gene regulator protein AgrB
MGYVDEIRLITQFYGNFPNPILKAHANSTIGSFLLSILCFVTLSHYVMQLHLLIINFLLFVDSCFTTGILSLITFVMNNKKPIKLGLIETPNI